MKRRWSAWLVALSIALTTLLPSAFALAILVSRGKEVKDASVTGWQVALIRKGESPPSLLCGGVLFHPGMVLIAAHCFDSDRRESSYEVLYGSLDMDDPLARRVGVYRIRIFSEGAESYSLTTRVNDLAILQLSDNIDSRNIELARESLGMERPEPGTVASIYGWGKNERGIQQRKLHSAPVKVISNESCPNELNSALVPSMMCARSPTSDACKGDSGGALALQSGPGKFTLLGIVSMGSACGGEDNGAGIYTRISSYARWIDKTKCELLPANQC